MAKLHELLAVEGDLEGIFKSILDETKHTFSKKPGLFFGFNKKLEMFAEEEPDAPEEQQELDCTVKDKMDYMAGHIVRYFDAILQKEKTNQSAVADLIVDGVVIAEKLPATFLLGLEKRLKLVREVYKQIPTLPLGKKWLEDSTMGQGVYLCHTPDEKFKTRKVFRFNVLYEATPEHPAQIEKWEEQENVGKYVTVTWSGMITSAKKSSILGRVDKLIRATKKARQRANAAEVVELSVGKEIFDYIGLGSV